MVNFGNVRLVGMTPNELQKMYKHDIRIDPATGLQTVYMLPDDVILNTRRAFSVSTTTADGYSTALGAPEGRYIAPANSENCIQLKAGDCAPRTLLIRAPWFTRFDIGVTKRFPLKGRMNFEVAFDVLNLFDNINFNPPANPGTGATIFQVDQRLHGREQHLRSGRPPRPVDVPLQLVGRQVRSLTRKGAGNSSALPHHDLERGIAARRTADAEDALTCQRRQERSRAQPPVRSSASRRYSGR